MRRAQLPALLYQTPCFACGTTLTFPLFVASFYNFRTYRGRATGDFYQVEETARIEEKLAAARAREGGGGIELLPGELTCSNCGVNAGVSRDSLKGLSGAETAKETVVEGVLFD